MKPFVADVHTHSILSGHAFGTVRELAAEAAAHNLQILGVTEHGPGIPGTCDIILFRNFIDAPRNLYGVEMLYGENGVGAYGKATYGDDASARLRYAFDLADGRNVVLQLDFTVMELSEIILFAE